MMNTKLNHYSMSKPQLIKQIQSALKGDSDTLVFFSQRNYSNGEKPAPDDLFEAKSNGQTIVKPYNEINGKLGYIAWREERTYCIDSIGAQIEVQTAETVENIKKLSQM